VLALGLRQPVLKRRVGDNKVAGSSVMLMRRFHERFGLRDLEFAVCGDFELWTRAFRGLPLWRRTTAINELSAA